MVWGRDGIPETLDMEAGDGGFRAGMGFSNAGKNTARKRAG
jgi:hypothetical protein